MYLTYSKLLKKIFLFLYFAYPTLTAMHLRAAGPGERAGRRAGGVRGLRVEELGPAPGRVRGPTAARLPPRRGGAGPDADVPYGQRRHRRHHAGRQEHLLPPSLRLQRQLHGLLPVQLVAHGQRQDLRSDLLGTFVLCYMPCLIKLLSLYLIFGRGYILNYDLLITE